MARGSKTGFGNLDQVFAQIRGLKKGESVRIEFSVPDPEEQGKYIDEGHESGISGRLVAVKDKSYEYEGDEILQAQLVLEDEEAGEVYFLSFGMSWVGRNIINSLAGCNNIGEIDISVWNDKSTGYAKVHIKNNGEKTEWGYPYEVLKEKISVTKVKEKGKIVDKQDTWDLDIWLLEEVLLKEVAAKLPKRAESATQAAPEAEEEVPTKAEESAPETTKRSRAKAEPEAEEAPATKRSRSASRPAASLNEVKGSKDAPEGDNPPF